MKKKPVIQFRNQPDDRSWTNGGDIEIMMYARSLHRTAMKLVASLDLQPNPKAAWDACPVVLLYREATELHLKALVGEGGSFLKCGPIRFRLQNAFFTLAGADRLPDHQGGSMGERIQVRRRRQPCRFQCSGQIELEALDPVAVVVCPGNRRPDCLGAQSIAAAQRSSVRKETGRPNRFVGCDR